MEKIKLPLSINKKLARSILQKGIFGRTGILSVWVEASEVANVAAALKADPELGLDWLENLSAAQVDDALVFTYFLRSHANPHTLIMRATSAIPTDGGEVELPSVDGVWPMARPMEAEIAELFGVRFPDSGGPKRILPRQFKGYPLRKNFRFPEMIGDIRHARDAEKA